MMELYDISAELNFNLNSHLMEFENMKDVIIFTKNSGSDSCDGSTGNQRVQANARERFRTHRFEVKKFRCDKKIEE
jgi:hypothetical protein